RLPYARRPMEGRALLRSGDPRDAAHARGGRPPSTKRGLSPFVAIALCFGAMHSDALALERLQRKFDLERGLPFSEVNSIAQDASGFLWITAGGGLFRYDGVELRPWAREPDRRYIKVVAAGPSGEILVREGPGDVGRLDEVVGDAIRPVEGPRAIVGRPIWDKASRAWAIGEDGLWPKAPGDAFRRVDPGPWSSERA